MGLGGGTLSLAWRSGKEGAPTPALTDEVLHRSGGVQALTGKGVDQGNAAVVPYKVERTHSLVGWTLLGIPHPRDSQRWVACWLSPPSTGAKDLVSFSPGTQNWGSNGSGGLKTFHFVCMMCK